MQYTAHRPGRGGPDRREGPMSKKHRGGPGPTPPGNRPNTGPQFQTEPDNAQPTKGDEKQRRQHGRVVGNGSAVTQFDCPLLPGDRVEIAAESAAPVAAGLPIVFEDDHLVVIDKPAGLLTVATEAEKEDTAFVRLRE